MQSNGTISVTRIPEDEEREKGAEGVLEQIIAEKFPHLWKEKGIESKRHRKLPSDIT